MKISESWLREWVDPPVSTQALVAQLTGAGLEVDGVEPAAAPMAEVVIGRIVGVEPHPDAERLQICAVDAGAEQQHLVVCGAPNARAGLRSAYVPVGARIADGKKIRRSKIRGVASEGMLCSARELGLGDAHEGILELPDDAPVGERLERYLALDDQIIEIDLTPNRGECLGIAGIAREVGALNRCPVTAPEITRVKGTIADKFPVALEAPLDCPRYVGRVIRGIDPAAHTPIWMRERLRRCGLRPISPVVDVTNYVMLELGQPMHAFDWAKLEGGIHVRRAREGEEIQLLDERTVSIAPSTLVIADEKRAVALAGIMGGLHSAVTAETEDIFLESAFFSPRSLIGQARLYGMHTDASHRFERGVDPELQRRAAERATRLLLDIVGGSPGPIVDEVSAVNMPRRTAIRLRSQRVALLIGMPVDAALMCDVLERLGMIVENSGEEEWNVTPPSYRFDLTMEADLIEEIARLVGYDAVPSAPLGTLGRAPRVPEAEVRSQAIRERLVSRGYQEAVTYSFVDPGLQQLLDPEATPIPLSNPISSEMAVMRTNLWPGLVDALLRNVNRQQERVRLFELGLAFRHGLARNESFLQGRDGLAQVGEISQLRCLAGIACGPAFPEQWGLELRDTDFFDVKGDLAAVLALAGREGETRFVPAAHPALHPGQSASIEMGDDDETQGQSLSFGWIGALHPEIGQRLKLPPSVLVFQIALGPIRFGRLPRFAPASRFPAVRRDLALVVDEAVPAEALRRSVGQVGPDVLKNLEFFDVYRGEGIDSGKKSVGIALTFQSGSRTLNDDEVEQFVSRIISVLGNEFGAGLRG